MTIGIRVLPRVPVARSVQPSVNSVTALVPSRPTASPR